MYKVYRVMYMYTISMPQAMKHVAAGRVEIVSKSQLHILIPDSNCVVIERSSLSFSTHGKDSSIVLLYLYLHTATRTLTPVKPCPIKTYLYADGLMVQYCLSC